MSTAYRFTPFPSLHSTTSPFPSAINSTPFSLPTNTTKETVVNAWAYLLRGYCPAESVVFSVDGRIVSVEFEGGLVQDVDEEVIETPTEEIEIGRWSAVYFDKPTGPIPQIYLVVDIAESTAILYASTEVIPPVHLKNLTEQFTHIAANIPSSQSALIPPFSPSATITSSHLLSIINPNPVKLPGPTLLHQLIRFSLYGDKTALEYLPSSGTETTKYSYAELDILSTKFAIRLRPHLTHSSNIPILIPQSPELYIAILGILKAGGAFVPLPLDAPPERIAFIVSDVSASCIVTLHSYDSLFTFDTCPPLVTVTDEDLDTDPNTCVFSLNALLSLPSWIDEKQAAYIMYTSGSTGTPKGVAIQHAAASQSLLAHERHVPVFERWLQFASGTFDVFVFEMFFPLTRGKVLVGCERGRMLDDLQKVVRMLRVDATELTPTVASGLLGARKEVPGLKVLLTIGEMLTRSVVDEWSGGVLQGMYGPTEVAIHCTVAARFRKDAKVGDIGVPFDGVSLFVLAPERDVEVLPVGWVGELALGGWQLAEGYVNRPELTAEVFVKSRWGRLYRTGDRARILPDGRVECLGRVGAGQVKLRGQRVELGEVEEVVLKAGGAKGCVASVIDGTMVVWVGGEVSKRSVLETCNRWLPRFMVPGDVVVFDELPRLPSGKADRKRLEKDYRDRVVEEVADWGTEMGEVERVIVHAVETLLGVKPGKEASLIALGLDSIQAIRLVSILRAQGFKLEVIDILKADCVNGIAEILSSPSDEALNQVDESVSRRFIAVEAVGRSRLLGQDDDIEKVIPCTSMQEAMLAETARDGAAYCNWILLEISEALDAVVVEKAVRGIIDGNEILRTGFVVLDEGFAQVVYRSSRAAQFSIGDNVDATWSTTMEQLLEPPFNVALVKIDGWKLNIRIHHTLYDGWCWEQVMADLSTLLSGRVPCARPQFAKFVERELSRPARVTNASIEYWQNTLSGFVPSKFPDLNGFNTVVDTVGIETCDLKIARAEYEVAARALGVSPQTIVQAAWAFLLAFYVGSNDVVFGTVVSGRTVAMEGVEDLIGPTILTLPVRVGVDRERGVKEVVVDVAKRGREMLVHELGLREIRKACEVESQLFDSLLVWQQTLRVGEGEGVVKMVDGMDRLEFALLIEIEPGVERISLKATYQRSVLPTAQMKLILNQLDQLVSGIVSGPDHTLASLQSIFAEDVLAIENPNPSPQIMANVPTLADLVERAAAKSPNAIAVEFANDIVDGVLDSTKLTYSELNSQANQLACHLLSLGVATDELVCVRMEKSPILYISILAILKAGAGYLPLTPETPEERVSQILANAEVKLYLTATDSEKLGFPEGVQTIVADKVNLRWYSKENPKVDRLCDNLAYAVFTSGSTGVPKGVLINNYSAVNNMLVLDKLYPTKSDSRLLQFSSIAFDVSVFEIFFTWSLGMTLCSGTKDVLLRDIEGAINALGVTHLSMTPTAAALVNPDNVPLAKFLVTVGEALNQKLFGDWADRGLYQAYGPSETVNVCTVRPKVSRVDHFNNIGAPLLNTSAFVVSDQDEEFSPVPRGGIGELCFGGAQVGRGYLKMPDLTNRKFIKHPKFGRIYRTGDIGRMLSDGSLEFVGRQDDQVKIRGHRVELGEISSVLLRSVAVLDAITMPIRKTEVDAYQLVAFIILNGRQNRGTFTVVQDNTEVRRTVAELYAAVGRFLPPYMIPAAIIPVTALPMTATGKADKRALERSYFDMNSDVLESYTEGSSGGEGGDQEWTVIERKVVNIIAEIARVSFGEIGRNTSIFRLGLDSISAIQLSNRIMEAGFPRLDVSQIMRNPTVSSLATLLNFCRPNVAKDAPMEDILWKFSKEVKASVLEQLKISEDDIVKILPCTPLQEAMLSRKKGMDLRTYYNHTVLNLKADPTRLEKAWAVMLQRHEIMRTCFSVTSHSRHAYAQVVLKTNQLPWVTFNVEATPKLIDERIVEVSSSISSSQTPYAFSLFATPERATLVMSFHHSLYDGFAMELLLEDVRKAYLGLEIPSRLPFDSVLEYMENLDLTTADTFWKSMLTGLEPTSFPDLTGKTAVFKENNKLTGMSSARIKCSNPLNSIEEGCRNLSISLLALGQMGWARMLSIYSGETDICFGSVVSGRTIPVEGVEDIIAPCFNTVPLRVQLTPGSTNMSIMDTLQSLNTDILPYQLTPLRRIMNIMRTEGQRLFDTLFILQHAHQSSFEDLWEEIEDHGEMDFSVVVELVPSRSKNSLDIVFHFRRDIILEEHVNVLLSQLDSIIVSSLELPSRLAIDFSPFDCTLLSTANSEPVHFAYDEYDLLHSEFERHACESPTRNALEFLDDSGNITIYTFEKLNQVANQVAHYLLSLGLRRDEAVPLCLEKSPIFYICVLGVLKAGCAFTPIDPSLPVQRKNFMLKELEAKFVLVTATTSIDLVLPAGVKAVEIDTFGLLDSLPLINPKVKDLSPQCLAYRLYTSGSTGQPKAVSLEIKSAVHTFKASKTLIPWKIDSRLLQFAATTFDMCYYDCFMAWSYGFTLCSASRKHLLGDLEGAIKSLKASMLDLTPTVASTLHAINLPGVEILYCIGEAMPQKLVDDWDDRCLNSYGPTEAAMCCTITATSKQIKSSNIGKPFPTTSFFILSRDGEYLVPKFGSGELCIGGPQIAREYHKNLQLTQTRFIQLGGKEVYRTGDIVRMLADGTFEFIGRADDQVKIRGLRVELDEINSVLRGSHANIKDATTIVISRNENAKEQLVSFLAVGGQKQHGISATVSKSNWQTEEILSVSWEVACERLPRYMIPSVILIIDHIPLSAAGKVDKKALGALFREQDIQSLGASNVEDEDESTWTDNQLKIRDIFSQISQVPAEQISRSSTIYEIGLDSISAAQVAMKLKCNGIEISVLDILERPSITQMSKLLITDSRSSIPKYQASDSFFSEFNDRFIESICKETGVIKKNITGIFPCTPAQEGMLSQFLRSRGDLYFNHIIFNLPQGVDLARLRKSWDVVFSSHEMLRAGFVEVDDTQHSFATIIHHQDSINLPWSKLNSVGDTAKLISTQKELNTSQALQKLHLPPWSITILKGGSGEHLLLFSAHHALYDAQSLSIVLDDVFCEYSGKHITPQSHFSGFLRNILKHTLDSKVLDEDKLFWMKQLQGSSISRFPNLCPLRVQATTSHVCSVEMSWSLSKIKTACRKLGISVNFAGQAAWARVLSAYMGDNSVTMGIVLSGRSGITNAEGLVFPCIATVPSFCLLTGTNRELALALQHKNAQLLKHQHTPLRYIQGWFDHPQESFFDSIFIYQKASFSREKSLSLWEVVEENAFVDYTISLEIEPTDVDSLLVRATCRENVVPKEQTQLLLNQFEAAMMDILQNPDGSSTDFSNFPHTLLSCTPARVDEIPTDTHLLHKFVEKYRQLTPEKVAYEFATSIQEGCAVKETWTYTQLDEEGNRIANYLLQRGVKTGEIIGICFEKCPEASFAILGILKAGCAFLALDHNAPIDRKAFIIEDSRAKYVLTMDKFAKELRSKLEVDVLALDSDITIKTSPFETPIVPDLKPDDLCYCLYTSGTTGTPKGCELTHENAIQAMLAFQRLFSGHWDSESRFLQFAAFHFDVSVLEQYWSWSVGICVTSAPRDLIFQDLALTIKELQITHLDLTPSLAALIRPEDVPSLCRGVFITGGEQLKQEILDTWGAKGVIYNGYGPTEVTIGCTMYPRVPVSGKPSNIGPQFDNVGSFVFTPGTNKPVLRGGLGELCVSGKLVGRGYLNRPSLTEERFPYLEEFDTRIYRTGDLVRILHDDTFDFAGRADDQVKLRGQRLEIGEINAILKQADPRVIAVTTLVLRHPKQQKDQLVSFIVLGKSKVSTDSVVLDGPEQYEVIPLLADACRRKLPVYMVPTHFLPISKMPLSVNNKVDNKKLTAVYQETPLTLLQKISRKEVHDENWTDAEQRIRKILVDMTGIQASEIRRSSTVFELGLDSVSVVGLARKLKKDGFFASSVSLVMQYPQVKRLAAELSTAENNNLQDYARMESINQKLAAFSNKSAFEVCERIGLEPDQIEAIVPCTALQEGMILRFINSEKPLYYNSFLFSLDKSTDVNLLYTAWNTVVKSTGVLRTCFCETSDGYAQVVLKSSEVCWKEIPVRSDGEVQRVVSDEMSKHTGKNRDLHQTPLYLLLLRTPSRCIIVVNIFHALYDGNSLPLILSDVRCAYQNQFRQRPHQFFEIISHILSVDLDNAQTFWKASLVDVKPTSFPRLASSLAHGDHLVQLIPELATKDVEEYCRKLNCTPQSVFQAAWAIVLSRYLGTQFAFGVVVSGRSLPIENIEATIGPLFNTIPCYLNVNNALSLGELVQQAHRFNSESIAHHHTPLRLINKWMRVSPEDPLFDTLFVYQKDMGGKEFTEPPIWEIINSSTVADYPLALEIEETLNGLTFTVFSKSSVLTKQQSSTMLSDFETQLQTILKDPHGKFSMEKMPNPKPLTPGEFANGIQTNYGQTEFTWGPETKTLQTTIAALAGVKESEVDEDSSIFELGLDSIEAIKLSSRLRSNGIKLSVSRIMKNPTIRKLQDVLNQSMEDTNNIENGHKLLEFEKQVRRGLEERKYDWNQDHIEAIYPATPVQEGMIAETLASEYKLYFNHDALEIADWVDLARLKDAWQSVVRNSEILRMSFFRVSEIFADSPYAFGQVVHKRPRLTWNETILPSEENVINSIRDTMRQATQDVNMLQEPPLRINVMRTPKTKYLILSISHALYDGWSMSLLHEDVHSAYFGSPPSRPSCRALLENIFNTNPKDSERFWKQMLTGASPSSFPTLADQSFPTATHRFERQSALPLWKIQDFCKQAGVTLQSLGQTCWALLLAHYLGQPDVLFGTVLSGRDFASADEIIFPAMNTLPVRAIIHGDYRDMLRYIHNNAIRVLKYQQTPLRQIQKLVDNQGQRIFDTLFIYQRGREPPKSNGKSLWHSIEAASDVEYNICVEMEHNGKSLVWRNACKSKVMTITDSETLLQILDSLLVHIINDINHQAIKHSHDGISFGNIPATQTRCSTSITSLNGLRINLDETATIIQKGQDGISDSAAIITKENGRSLLIIFVTMYGKYRQQTPYGEDAFRELARFARQSLPHWLIPSFIIPMDTLPYGNNKIDRSQLESHFLAMPFDEREKFAVQEHNHKWSPQELTFRRILSRVSQLPESEIERTQTIFHLGLDSISVINVSSELRKESIFLSVTEILRAATIERMAALVKTMNGAPETSVDTDKILQKALEGFDMQHLLSEIPKDSIESVMPATSGQLYMLSAWKNSNYKLFMPTFTFKCQKIELSRILSAWESLIRQEPILRTTFLETESDDMPLLQLTLRNPPVQYEWYQSSTTKNDTFISFLASQEQQKSLNLKSPPVRLAILNTPVDTIIFLTIHHALYDGVSLPLLLSKLEGFLENDAERLPTPASDTPCFLDFVKFACSQDVQKQSTYWSRYLDGAVSTLVPLKHPELRYSGRTEVFQLGALGESSQLENLCRAEGISLHSVFLAAYAKVYAYHVNLADGPVNQRKDVVFGIYLSNRHLPVLDLPSMTAPTLNIVPLRVCSPKTTSIIQLARQIQMDLVEIGNAGNGMVGLWQIEKWTGVQVDCFFNFLKLPGSSEEVYYSGAGGKGLFTLEELKVDLKFESEVDRMEVVSGRSWMGSAKTNLDIEVAVRGDKVDIGVFSWAQNFNDEDALNTIKWMCDIVMGAW